MTILATLRRMLYSARTRRRRRKRVSITASRTTGVAPLGVFFEATISGAAQDNPFHDLLYVWDFGEPGIGNFAYGNTLNNAKNEATGPVAAHVFSEDLAAATATVTVTVYERVGGVTSLFASSTVDIVTTDMVDHFDQPSGTVFYSLSGTEAHPSFTNGINRITPNEVTRAQIETDVSNGIRAWFFYGPDGDVPWQGGMSIDLGATGPYLFGTYGAGTATLASTSYPLFFGGGSNDIRVINLGLSSTTTDLLRTSDYCKQWLFLDVLFKDHGSNAVHIPASQFTLNDIDVPNELFFHGCVFSSTDQATCFRMACRKSSVQGCDMNSYAALGANPAHTYRVYFSERLVIQHNGMSGNRDTTTQVQIIKFNGLNAGVDPFPGLSPVMKNIIISDNVFTHQQTESVKVGTSETGGREMFGDVILERNHFAGEWADTTSGTMFVMQAGKVSFRNNTAFIASLTQSEARMVVVKLAFGDLDDFTFWCNNNTFTNLMSPKVTSPMVQITAGVTGSNVNMSNNLFYRDEGAGAPPLHTIADGGPVNTDDTNLATATNPLSVSPPMVETDFRLASGSAAENAGTETDGVLDGYERTSISSMNQGAFQTDL